MASSVNLNESLFPQAINQFGGNLKQYHETMFGKPERNYQESRYTPEIQGGLNQLIQQGIGQQKNNAFDFAPVEQQARKDYQTKTLPTIANRFLTGSNSRNSGNFQHILASSGKDLELGLAQLKNQFGQQNFQNLMQLLGGGAQQNIHRPETFGLAGELAKEVPHAVGAYFGGGGGQYLGGLLKRKFGGSGTDTGAPEAEKTEGGPTSLEQDAKWRAFLETLSSNFGNNNQNPADESGQGQYPEQDNGLTQIQQLIRNLGTPEGQFNNRNIGFRRYAGGY